MYLDYVDYIEEKGKEYEKDILVYALSTCGFCRRGLAFLRENNLPFHYIYVDQLPYDIKTRLKQDLRAKYDKRVVFPYLIINSEKVILGYVKDQWEKELLGNKNN
ncbi:MAG: glutaredoxin family protein [Promethearchaeota archaeon]